MSRRGFENSVNSLSADKKSVLAFDEYGNGTPYNKIAYSGTLENAVGSSIYCKENNLFLVTNEGVFIARERDDKWTQILDPGSDEHFVSTDKYLPSRIVVKSENEFYILFWSYQREDYELYMYECKE